MEIRRSTPRSLIMGDPGGRGRLVKKPPGALDARSCSIACAAQTDQYNVPELNYCDFSANVVILTHAALTVAVRHVSPESVVPQVRNLSRVIRQGQSSRLRSMAARLSRSLEVTNMQYQHERSATRAMRKARVHVHVRLSFVPCRGSRDNGDR